MKTKAPKVILNLAEVTGIDADGLEALVFCYTQIRERVLTKPNTVFEVFVDEQDAVNSFFPGRAVRQYDVLKWGPRGRKKRLVLTSGFRKGPTHD